APKRAGRWPPSTARQGLRRSRIWTWSCVAPWAALSRAVTHGMNPARGGPFRAGHNFATAAKGPVDAEDQPRSLRHPRLGVGAVEQILRRSNGRRARHATRRLRLPLRRPPAQRAWARRAAGGGGAAARPARQQRSLLRMARADRRGRRSSQFTGHRSRTRPDGAVRRQGAGNFGLLPRPRRLADGIHVLWSAQMSQAHDPTVLPDNIPAPIDDGAARHLKGMRVADIALPAPGGTTQSCSFRDHHAELTRLGVKHLFGLSTQDTAYQQEAVDRLHLPFAILSDEKLAFAKTMNLP